MRSLAVASTLAVLLCAGAAHAQRRSPTEGQTATSFVREAGPHTRPLDLSVLVGTPGLLLVGFGGGVRIAIPLLHDGLIGSINDAIKLETGLEFYHWSFSVFDYESIAIPIQLRWDFYVAPDWTVFAAAGIAINAMYFEDGAGFFDPPGNVDAWGFGSGAVVTTALGAGALWSLSESVALRLDASLNLLGVGITARP